MNLMIKTADDIAEMYLYDDKELKNSKKWNAGQKLSETLLSEINNIVGGDFDTLNGIVVFVGPGSFTGLRIGISVTNALAYGKNLQIIGEDGEDWIEKGIKRITNGEDDKVVTPKYGSEANISKPK